MTSHANSHLSVVEIDGRTVPVVHRPQCRVCRSPQRPTIERALIEGLPPRTIARQLPNPSDVSARNITEHRRRGHLPIDTDAVLELRAAYRIGPTAQLAFDATVAEAATASIAAAVLELVHSRLSAGEIDVTIKDGLRAAKVLAAAEKWPQRLAEAHATARRIESHRMAALDQLLTLVRTIGGETLFAELLTAGLNSKELGVVLLDRRLGHHTERRAFVV